MDILGILWVPDSLVWFAILAISLYIYGVWPYSYLSKYGYKGPKPQPFFGNVKLVFNSGHIGKWDLTGKHLYGKVFSLYEGRQPTIVVFDTDILKQVLVKQFPNFVDRRKLPLRGKIVSHSLIDVKGDEWRRIRNLTTPFFTTGKLKRNMELLESCCSNLINKCEEHVQSQQHIDIKKLTGAFTLEAICLTAFGLNINSQENPDHILLKTLKSLMQTLEVFFTGYNIGVAFPFLITLLEKFGYDMWPKGSIETLQDLTKVAIEERQKSHQERPDFIQAMIRAHEEDIKLHDQNGESSADANMRKALTEEEIVAQVALFAVAGHDTTATTLSFLLLNLAMNPDCQERVVQEINDVISGGQITYDNLKKMVYLDMCLEESQRLYPAALRIDRKCIKDTTINNYFIPKDTLVVVPVYGLHHDPELWNDPDMFDPERFNADNRAKIDPYSYLPFGLGPRNCVGMRLAQIEIKMATINILHKYKVMVSNKTKMPIKLKTSFFPRAEGGIHLTMEKR